MAEGSDVDQVGRRAFLRTAAVGGLVAATAGTSGLVAMMDPAQAAAAPERRGAAIKKPVLPSTLTLRNDPQRTGTTPGFPFGPQAWQKYGSWDIGSGVRAGLLIVSHWTFRSGPHKGTEHNVVLVATTTNEVFAFSESALLGHPGPKPPPTLWHTKLGVAPIINPGSNIGGPIGVCGTPVVDVANRRMFVLALWQDTSGAGHATIFQLDLDTGAVTSSAPLIDQGASYRPTFDAGVNDQRTAINLAGGWLWFGFADLLANDMGRYYGWLVAVNPDDLEQQLFGAAISLGSSQNFGIYGGGIWGCGGVAAAADGSVYVLTGNATQVAPTDLDGTDPSDLLDQFGLDYWGSVPAEGPGSMADYFNGLIRVTVRDSDGEPELTVLDWFQGSRFTQAENSNDLDFGGSNPVVLPGIDGTDLVAFVPKDGNIFVLDAGDLGHWCVPLTDLPFANCLVNGGDDTKVAIAFTAVPDGSGILTVGADSNGPFGGFAAYALDASVVPPTLTQLWLSPHPLRDSFASPTVIANPVPHPSTPTAANALAWVLDGDNAGYDNLQSCAMRAYDIETGTIAYDSTLSGEVTEQVPNFGPITAGGHSVFCPTTVGFMAFNQPA